ncbi:MAG: LamG-like jellyroll fold domain-containing protein, partial [Bacteroidales bacterium]|nr:LamG-like jellyroll fold domain-containing protein [Bacteroidales bacterium]
MYKKIILIAGMVLLPFLAFAQQATTSSSAMKAGTWAVRVPYDLGNQGTEYQFICGQGGWRWDFFGLQMRNYSGSNYSGTPGIHVARVGFTGRWSASYTSLSSEQTSELDLELQNIRWIGSPSEVKVFLLSGIGNVGDEQGSAGGTPSWNTTQRTNYVDDIVRAVQYVESKGYTIMAVAPFNEPDFETTYTGNASNYSAVAQIMQGRPILAGKVYGPSTLNSTQAGNWYSTVKNNINFVNTHQLAGNTFAQYTSFWQTAKNDGKRLIADEMHNVMEAMVCAYYGGEAGTWWGYNGVTRGEYTNILQDGVQLAYKERPSEWMVATVIKYKYQTNRAQACSGSSERQGVATAFTFVSRGRLGYYDGEGPFYDYTQNMPGGASGSYSSGQTNAERMININFGEDVPVEPINGTYKIVNKASGKVLSLTNGNATVRDNVYQWADGGLSNQAWNVTPSATSHSDFSYVTIRNANTSTMYLYLDAQAWAMDPGANVSAWSDGDWADPNNDWQYWHVRYAGDGYYYIINHNTGLYLEVAGASSANGANVQQWTNNGNDCQKWKFVPADHAVDQTAPNVPQGLTAEGQSGSVKLTWTANTDADIYRYMIYRYNTANSLWECIGRKVSGTSFIDNTCRKGQTLRYRIRALDKSYNLSQPSAEVTATLTTEHAMVAKWNGNNLNDASKNKLNAVASPAGVSHTTNETHAAFQFNGSTGYVELPYYVGDFQEMTFATWARGGSTTSWQRIFDFGNGEDSYLFLTPTNGSRLRFEIKANGTTQGLNATTTLGTNTWKHIAVTIGPSAVKIYVNGTLDATATDITLRPSDVAPTLCYLGRSMFDVDPAFNGMLSDVRIYNYELTASEVAALADITDNTSSGYDITAERLPGIADNVNNWDTHSGTWATYNGSATNMTAPFCRTSSNSASELSKTLKYLPDGSYKMTANAYASVTGYTSRNNQELFVNTAALQINSARNTTTGTPRELTGVVVTNDNTLKFGYRTKSGTPANYLAIDNVKIVYQGTAEEFAEGLEDITYGIIGDAESLLSKPMNKDVKAALQTAVTNVTNALNAYTSAVTGGTATKAIADTWINALDNFSGTVVTNAQNSITAYANLRDAMDAAEAKADAHPQTTDNRSGFNNELGAVEDNYLAGEYLDTEIPEAINETKRIANRYVMADAVVNARETNVINVTNLVVDNPNFDGDSYANWTTTPVTGCAYGSVEYWNTTFNLYQVLYGMPAGTYRFETRGFYRYGGQPENYTAYNNGTLQRNAKIYIIDAAGGQGTKTADVMAISDDPTPYHEWGAWSSQTYNGSQVPDNMQAASEAIDVRGRYVPKNGMNTVTLSYSEGGDLTVGVLKDVEVGADWSFFGDFSLYYLGNYVTLNETAAALPVLPSGVRSTTFNIDMTRTIVSNDNASSNNAWNTICFPFALSRTQIEDAFGEDAVVKELASVTVHDGSSASLYFSEVNAIEANVPYIMKTDQAGSNYIFKGIGYTPSENPAVTVDGVQFVGNYAYPTFLANTNGNDYYILNDEFKHSSGKTKIKGFRAYFHVPASSGIKSLG